MTRRTPIDRIPLTDDEVAATRKNLVALYADAVQHYHVAAPDTEHRHDDNCNLRRLGDYKVANLYVALMDEALAKLTDKDLYSLYVTHPDKQYSIALEAREEEDRKPGKPLKIPTVEEFAAEVDKLDMNDPRLYGHTKRLYAMPPEQRKLVDPFVVNRKWVDEILAAMLGPDTSPNTKRTR